jgi:hypothetical protein
MLGILGDQSAYRTALDALSAGDTNRFLKRLVTKGADLELITPIGHVNGVNAHNFPAGSDTYATLDALIRIEIKERIACVNGKIPSYPLQAIESLLIKADAVDECLQAACPTLRAEETVEIVVA